MIRTSSTNLAVVAALVLTFAIAIVKGGSTQWSSLIWVTACCLILSALLAVDGLEEKSAYLSIKTLFKTPFIFILAFQIWTLIQSLTNVSQDLTASLENSLVGIGMICLLAIWYKALRHAFVLNLLYGTLISFTLVQSVYGLAIMLSGVDQILWMPKLHYLDRPTGFFVNANHFATYLVLTIICMLFQRIIAMNVGHRRSDNRKRNSAFKVIDQIYSPSNLAIAFLLITLLMTKSFGALTALCVVLGIMVCSSAIRHKQIYQLLLGGVLALIILGVIFLSLDYSIVEQELSGLSHTWSRRLALSQAASSMLSDHWLFGVGGGSFYSQFSAYRTLDIGNSYYNFAHNDLIQFWVEYGLIGVTLLALFTIAALRDNFMVIVKGESAIRKVFAYTSIYGAIAVGVHSLVDFPLHMPGLSVLFVIMISINSLIDLRVKLRSAVIKDD